VLCGCVCLCVCESYDCVCCVLLFMCVVCVYCVLCVCVCYNSVCVCAVVRVVCECVSVYVVLCVFVLCVLCVLCVFVLCVLCCVCLRVVCVLSVLCGNASKHSTQNTSKRIQKRVCFIVFSVKLGKLHSKETVVEKADFVFEPTSDTFTDSIELNSSSFIEKDEITLEIQRQFNIPIPNLSDYSPVEFTIPTLAQIVLMYVVIGGVEVDSV